MTFCFYPNHEFACLQLRHCPHLGGAGLASLVLIANRSEATRESSLHTIRTLEKQNATLLLNVVELQDQLAQAKLELKLGKGSKGTHALLFGTLVANVRRACYLRDSRAILGLVIS